MKKFALLFILLAMLHSCSSDDSSSSNSELTTEGYLIKKAIVTDNSGGVVTTDYFYNENKILNSTSSNGYKQEYTYIGDLITKSDLYLNNVLQYSDYYQYNAQQKLIERKVLNLLANTAFKSDFIYNADNTVNVNTYTGNLNSQTSLMSEKKIFLLPNGDVDKIENYVVVGGLNHTRTQTHTYDTMNATSNSILGMNKLKLWDSGNTANYHNMLSAVSATTENAGIISAIFQYTYNSFGFPVTGAFTAGTSLIQSSQFFYQQP